MPARSARIGGAQQMRSQPNYRFPLWRNLHQGFARGEQAVPNPQCSAEKARGGKEILRSPKMTFSFFALSILRILQQLLEVGVGRVPGIIPAISATVLADSTMMSSLVLARDPVYNNPVVELG